MIFKCPECESEHELDGSLIGQKVECPCGKKFVVTEDLVLFRTESFPPPLPAQQPDCSATTHGDLLQPPADSAETNITIDWKEPAGTVSAEALPTDKASVTFPERLGKTRIIEQIGRGAVGVVFKAEHTVLDIPVAVKVISPKYARDHEAIERFHREAKTAAKLNHPNIVRVLDCDNEHGILFIVMEYVGGGNLKEYIEKNGPLPPRRALKVVHSIASGLQEAEQNNIIHRDIKPDNIMISDQQEYKLADLGLARQVSSVPGGAEVTSVSVGMGTPHFMSPEQAFDARNVDSRADIYSLGCTFYYLLSGQPPYPDPDIRTVLFKHVNTPIPHIRDKVPEVPPTFDLIICKCMAKEPNDRYQSFGDLLADLELARKNRLERMLAFTDAPPDKAAASTPTRQVEAKSSTRRASSSSTRGRRRETQAGAATTAPSAALPVPLRLLMVLLVSKAAWVLTVAVLLAGIVLVAGPLSRGRRGLFGAREPDSALAMELRTLLGTEQSPHLRAEQRVMVLYKAAGVAVRLEKPEQCLAYFTRALELSERLSLNAVRTTLSDFYGALEHIVLALESNPAKLDEVLAVLSPRIAAVLGDPFTFLSTNLVKRLAQPLNLHCKVEPAPGFHIRFTYAFASEDELNDFIQPAQDWAVTREGKWLHRKDHWTIERFPLIENRNGLSVTVDGPTAVFWKVPHGRRFRVSYTATNLPESQGVGSLSLMSGASGIPSLSHADNAVVFQVAGGHNSFNAVVIDERDVHAKTPFSITGDETVNVEVETEWPRAQFRVNERIVFEGNLPDSARGHEGYIGLVTMYKSSFSSLNIVMPVADLISAARKGPAYLYPLMNYGTERLDRRSTCIINDLTVLEATDPGGELAEEDQRRLSAANGQYVIYSGRSPAVHASFPISPNLRASARAATVDVYAVSRFSSEQRTHSPGVVELHNRDDGTWIRGTLLWHRTSPSQNCFISHFRFADVPVDLCVGAQNELRLRHFDPVITAGTIRLGHIAVKF